MKTEKLKWDWKKRSGDKTFLTSFSCCSITRWSATARSLAPRHLWPLHWLLLLCDERTIHPAFSLSRSSGFCPALALDLTEQWDEQAMIIFRNARSWRQVRREAVAVKGPNLFCILHRGRSRIFRCIWFSAVMFFQVPEERSWGWKGRKVSVGSRGTLFVDHVT